MNVHAGRSADGVHWEIDAEPIAFTPLTPAWRGAGAILCAYDPRVTWLEDRYYVTWCNGYGPTIGVAYTRLPGVPPARQTPPLQPERRALPAQDPRRRDAEPAERRRAHALRRRLLLRESRPRPLGPAPPRARSRPWTWQSTKVERARLRSRPTRVARPLPRRAHVLQRLRLLARRRAARPRRAVARDRRGSRYLLAPQKHTNGSVMCRTSSSRAPPSSTPSAIGCRSTTAPPTPSSVSRTAASRRCKRPCVPEPALPAVPVRWMPASRIAAVPWCVGAPASSAASLCRRASGDSPSQQPSLKRQRALPRAVAPFHLRATAEAAFAGRRRAAVRAHPRSVETAPDGPREETQRAPHGAPGNVVLEKPGEEQDDDDERDQSATDVHSGLLYAVDVGTTAAALRRLRGSRSLRCPLPRRRGRVVRQRPAKPRTPVRFWSAPLSFSRMVRC